MGQTFRPLRVSLSRAKLSRSSAAWTAALGNATISATTPSIVSLDFSRRQFVKLFSFGTAASALSGVTPFLVEAEAASDTEGVFKIKLSDFPALQNTPTSIRLSPNPVGGDNFPQGFWYPFMINRDEMGNFYAIDTECTHAGCVVQAWSVPFGPATCPCHGSQYGIDGEVLGGPARESLRRFDISFDDVDTLTVRIPGLGFRVTNQPIQTSAGSRLRLTFPSQSEISYKVYHRQTATAPWVETSFAVTANGPVTQSSIVGNDTALSVYLPMTGTSGFYSVGIELLDVT